MCVCNVHRSDLALIGHWRVVGDVADIKDWLIDMIMIGALFIRAMSVIVCSEPLGINQALLIHHASCTAEEDEERRMSSGWKYTPCMTHQRPWSLIIGKRLRCSWCNDIISTQITQCEVKTKQLSVWVWSGRPKHSRYGFYGMNRWIL